MFSILQIALLHHIFCSMNQLFKQTNNRDKYGGKIWLNITHMLPFPYSCTSRPSCLPPPGTWPACCAGTNLCPPHIPRTPGCWNSCWCSDCVVRYTCIYHEFNRRIFDRHCWYMTCWVINCVFGYISRVQLYILYTDYCSF